MKQDQLLARHIYRHLDKIENSWCILKVFSLTGKKIQSLTVGQQERYILVFEVRFYLIFFSLRNAFCIKRNVYLTLYYLKESIGTNAFFFDTREDKNVLN